RSDRDWSSDVCSSDLESIAFGLGVTMPAIMILAANLEIEPEDHDRRHGHSQAKCDGLASRARRLNDVVFQDSRVSSSHFRPHPKIGRASCRETDKISV